MWLFGSGSRLLIGVGKAGGKVVEGEKLEVLLGHVPGVQMGRVLVAP